MEITIRGKDFRVSPAMEELAERKASRLSRFLPNIAEVSVDLERTESKHGGNRSTAQITVKHERGAILRAEESVTGDNMDMALTLALENMYRRIERFKGRRTRKGKTRFSLSVEELGAAETIGEEEYTSTAEQNGKLPDPYENDNGEYPLEIIRRKTVALNAMSEEEAVEQMEMLGHTFFMFFDDTTKMVSVVYKRRNGGYGMLVPSLP